MFIVWSAFWGGAAVGAVPSGTFRFADVLKVPAAALHFGKVLKMEAGFSTKQLNISSTHYCVRSKKNLLLFMVKASWNVMAHEQKPDFFFRRNGRVHLTLNTLTWRIWWVPNNASRWQMGFNSAFKGLNLQVGASVQSTAGSRGVRISGSNAGYTMFWRSVNIMRCVWVYYVCVCIAIS